MVPTPYVMSPPFWGKGWEFNESAAWRDLSLSLSSDGEAKEMDVERRISIGPVAMEARKGIHQYEQQQQQQQQQQQHHHHHHHHHHHSNGGALDSSAGGVICVTCVTCIDMCRLAIFVIRLLRLSSE